MSRDAMWYCPDCGKWNGSKLTECLEDGHKRPRKPVYNDQVPFDDSYSVTWKHRVKAKLGLL